jgi:hypothetical protein
VGDIWGMHTILKKCLDGNLFQKFEEICEKGSD